MSVGEVSILPPLVPPSPANFLRINIPLTQKLSQDSMDDIALNDVGLEFECRDHFSRPLLRAQPPNPLPPSNSPLTELRSRPLRPPRF